MKRKEYSHHKWQAYSEYCTDDINRTYCEEISNQINHSKSLIENTQEYPVNDELQMRFSSWMKIVVKRAKIDYIRRQKKHQAEISIEELINRDKLKYDFQPSENQLGFDFENDQVALAFSKLTPARRQILIMLFVQNLMPQEIAEYMHCTVQYIYNQRSLALKDLKLILSKGE